MEAVKNFFGLGNSTEGQAGAPVPPAAVTPSTRPAAANKLAALAPVSASATNASVNKTVTLPTSGGMSDFIGGAPRKKNLRKKYKMPGRRSTTRRASRKAGRKGRKATRKNRRASRKARN